jgi:phosphopantetheinyl transferase
LIVAVSGRPTVRLYCTDVVDFSEDDWRDFVAEGDLAALPRSAHPRRRAEHLAGRALLRAALQDCTGRPARSHRLRAGANGKPECVGGPEFSVAHSRGTVLCALAPAGRIGIDVEGPAPGRGFNAIAERYFSVDERRWIGAEAERFYMLWVLKEAYLKALGVGLTGGLRALTCVIDEPRIEAITDNLHAAPALALYATTDAFIAIAIVGGQLQEVTAVRWAPGTPLRTAPLQLIARTAT